VLVGLDLGDGLFVCGFGEGVHGGYVSWVCIFFIWLVSLGSSVC